MHTVMARGAGGHSPGSRFTSAGQGVLLLPRLLLTAFALWWGEKGGRWACAAQTCQDVSFAGWYGVGQEVCVCVSTVERYLCTVVPVRVHCGGTWSDTCVLLLDVRAGARELCVLPKR